MQVKTLNFLLMKVTLSLNDNTNDKANELKSLQSLHRRVGGEEEVLRKR